MGPSVLRQKAQKINFLKIFIKREGRRRGEKNAYVNGWGGEHQKCMHGTGGGNGIKFQNFVSMYFMDASLGLWTLLIFVFVS